jgi:hypothetical protein
MLKKRREKKRKEMKRKEAGSFLKILKILRHSEFRQSS